MASTPANSLNVQEPGFALFDGTANFHGPNQILAMADDFLPSINVGGYLGWSPIGNIGGLNGTATNPGIIAFNNAFSSQGLYLGANGQTIGGIVTGSGRTVNNWVFDLLTLSTVADNYTTYIGLFDTGAAQNATDPTYGIWFQYTDGVNGGKWQIVCRDGGGTTKLDSGVVASTGFHNYGFVVNAAGTSVSFTIDGVVTSNSPIVANITTSAMIPAVFSILNLGQLPFQKIDLWYFSQALTTAR